MSERREPRKLRRATSAPRQDEVGVLESLLEGPDESGSDGEAHGIAPGQWGPAPPLARQDDLLFGAGTSAFPGEGAAYRTLHRAVTAPFQGQGQGQGEGEAPGQGQGEAPGQDHDGGFEAPPLTRNGGSEFVGGGGGGDPSPGNTVSSLMMRRSSPGLAVRVHPSNIGRGDGPGGGKGASPREMEESGPVEDGEEEDTEDTDGDDSDGDDSDSEDVGPPIHLMRNVSGYDVREDRLTGVRCDSLVSGSESHFFRLMAACMSADVPLLLRSLESMSVQDVSQLNPVQDSPTYGLNPLHVARSVDVVSTLLSFGVPVDIEGLNGQTPLHTHTHHNRPRIIKFLVDRGAKVDAQTRFNGSTPLQWAVAADNMRVAHLLVRAGADVSYRNYSGNTALHMVGSVAMARFLVEHGARADVVNDDSKLPLEEAANRAVGEEELKVALYLLDVSRRSFVSADTKVKDHEHLALDELESYQSARPRRGAGATDGLAAARATSLHLRAKAKWQTIKRTFLRRTVDEKGGDESGEPEDRSGATSHEFYSTFFEVMVKERPKLALKLLDKHRTFLYWENDARIYSYKTGLLGTIPNSSFTVKQMVFYDQAELISHPVVQYILNLRWMLFTREILWFEFVIHVIFLILLLVVTLARRRGINFMVFSPTRGLVADPSAENWEDFGVLLSNLLLLTINWRYFKLQVAQARLAGAFSGTGSKWSRVLHSRLRNEPYYLVPHIFIFASQVLRCLHGAGGQWHKSADVLVAVISPQLFYRALSFGDGFQAIGVPLCTIRSMIASNMIYFLLVFVLISGFSHSMHLLFHDEYKSPEYGSMAMSWTTLFFFMFNLDVGGLNSEGSPWRKAFGFFMIGVYMFIVSLVTFQLICAVMTNKYEEINANSEAQYLLQKARLILFYEQYEQAQNSLFASSFVSSSGSVEELPPGDSRHFVKELVDGTVLLEVPKTFLDECTRVRVRHSRFFHRLRHWAFTTWCRARGSTTFLFPTKLSVQRPPGPSASLAESPSIVHEKEAIVLVGRFHSKAATAPPTSAQAQAQGQGSAIKSSSSTGPAPRSAQQQRPAVGLARTASTSRLNSFNSVSPTLGCPTCTKLAPALAALTESHNRLLREVKALRKQRRSAVGLVRRTTAS